MGNRLPFIHGRHGNLHPLFVGGACGLLWFLLCWMVLRTDSLKENRERLNFFSGSNVATLGYGDNEPYALALEMQSIPGSDHGLHRIRMEAPVYSKPLGRLGRDGWVEDFSIQEQEGMRLGIYLEVEAGRTIEWQDDGLIGLIEAVWRLPSGRIFQALDPGSSRRGHLLIFDPVDPAEQERKAQDLEPGELRFISQNLEPLYLRGLVRRLLAGDKEQNQPPLGRLMIRLQRDFVGDETPQKRAESYLFFPEGMVHYPLEGTIPSRAELMARSHDISLGALKGWVVVSAFSLGLGVMGMVVGVRRERGIRWEIGLGGMGMALGFSMVASIWIPPFQSTDEWAHPFAVAGLVRNEAEVREGIAQVGARVHAERKRWSPDDPITRQTFDQPDPFFVNPRIFDEKVKDQFIPNYWKRSPFVAWLWSGVLRLVEDGATGQILLSLRWVNSLFASLFVGVGMGWMASRMNKGGERWIVMGPLVVWSLPVFFGGLSNYSLLAGVSCWILGALGAVVRERKGEWSGWVGVGLGMGLLWLISVNGIGAILGVMFWMLGEGARRDPADRWHRWLGLVLGFMAVHVFSSGEWFGELGRIGEAKGLGGGLGWLPGTGVVVGGVLAAILEPWLRRLGTVLSRWGFLLGGVGWGLLALGIIWGATTCFVKAPELKDLEQPWRQYPGMVSSGCPLASVAEVKSKPSYLDREQQVWAVLRVFAMNLGIVPRDFILVKTFWAPLLNGEVRVPAWTIQLGVGLCWLGLVVGMWRVLRSGNSMNQARMAWGIIAWGIALSVTAGAYWPRNLYGRYALTIWVLVFGISFWAWGKAFERWGNRFPEGFTWIAMPTLVCWHGLWAMLLAERFFGVP